MADIDQIISGVYGNTKANFTGSGDLWGQYQKGKDFAYQQEGRNLFKGGVPTDANGQPDFAAMGKAMFEHGDVGQGVSLENVGIQRDQLQQGQKFGQYAATGVWPQDGQPQVQPQSQPQANLPPFPPSASRSASATEAPLRPQGGLNSSIDPTVGGTASNGRSTLGNYITGGRSPQGDQPGSIVGLVSAAGIPDELAGPFQAQLSARTKTDPNATLDPQTAQRVQQAAQNYAQQLRQGQGAPQGQPGQPQAPQAQPVAQMQPQQPSPQMAPQQAPQGARNGYAGPNLGPLQPNPNPFANAIAQGLIPPGVDPKRYVAVTTYAATVPGPQQKAAQEKLAAINSASQLTSEQKDYSAAQANPKLNDFTAQKGADAALASGIAASNVKEQDQVIADGRSGQKRLTTLNAITGIVNSDPNISLGFGAENGLKIKMALESMGVPKSMIGDLSGPQAIQKLNAALAAESTKGITARPSQFEFKTFLANNPGLSLDRDGLLRVAGITGQLAKRDYDLGQLAADNRYNWEKWGQIVKGYDRQNPVKDPTTGKVITTDSVIAPGPSKAAPASSAPGLKPPAKGDIVNGHQFQGGNPKDPRSWASIS